MHKLTFWGLTASPYQLKMQSLADQVNFPWERFTLEDARAFGQLSMNLADGRAAGSLQELAPRSYRWLCMILYREHRGERCN